MQNYKLTIEYDGTHFNGWQIQGKKERTIQGEITNACRTIFKQNLTVIGSGRTDSGVHARRQIANVKVKTLLSEDSIRNALNAHLPNDVAILKVEKVKSGFHAQFSARLKTYRYTIYNGKARSVLERNFCLQYPFPLNVAKMRNESKCLVGQHDFRSFQASDPARADSDTIRTVKHIKIKKTGDFIIIDIEANGFLYKMVRNIVGTLLKAGRGRLPTGAIKRILEQKDRTQAFETAKPQGLCLLEVKYRIK